MKIDRKFKPELCACKESARFAIADLVHLDVESSTAAATDGHCLVRVPVDVDADDHSGAVPLEAMKAARKLGGRKGEMVLACNGAARTMSGAQFVRPDVRFPDIDQVIPSQESRKDRKLIAINAELLARMQEALGADGVVLEIGDEYDAILVTPSDKWKSGALAKSDPIGVLMPMRFR